MTHIRVSDDVKTQLAAMAEEAGISTGQMLVNLLQLLDEQQERLAHLESRPRFPLNEAGDYTQIWGYPLVSWRNGSEYLCEHGYPLLLTPDGQILWLSPGHQCDFKPRG